jgi:hypothetical protein
VRFFECCLPSANDAGFANDDADANDAYLRLFLWQAMDIGSVSVFSIFLKKMKLLEQCKGI